MGPIGPMGLMGGLTIQSGRGFGRMAMGSLLLSDDAAAQNSIATIEGCGLARCNGR